MMSKNCTEEQKDLKIEIKGLQQQIHEQEQQKVHIEYDLVGYVPVDELLKAEQA